jgi:hypothetical protein
MSQSNELNDPIDRLSQFTPDLGGFDRDALLFAAGKNSARPNRFWIVVAGILLVSQSITLLILFQGSERSTEIHATNPDVSREPTPSVPSFQSSDAPMLLRADQIEKLELPYRPQVVEQVSGNLSNRILSVHSRMTFE